jgi:hypothetical protein
VSVDVSGDVSIVSIDRNAVEAQNGARWQSVGGVPRESQAGITGVVPSVC